MPAPWKHVTEIFMLLICLARTETCSTLTALYMQANNPSKVRNQYHTPSVMNFGAEQSNEMLLAGVHALIWMQIVCDDPDFPSKRYIKCSQK